MNFESNDVGNLQYLWKQLSHILGMRQQSIRVSITLAAMRQISVKAVSIVQTTRLFLRLRDHLFARRFELLKLTGVNFEIWYKRYTLVLCCHHYLLDHPERSNISSNDPPAATAAHWLCNSWIR